MTAVRLARGWADVATYAAAALVTSVLTFLALQLWRADLRVPLQYSGDALPVGAHFKTVIEEGWYEYQPRLGAPWGQNYHDFPTADNLHLVAAKLLALFTDDWALALNLYYLIGFPLAALAAVWFLRTCGVSRALSVSTAALFAIAPYHFIRSESHLWLSSYYAVPLALGLLVLILRGEPLFATGPSSNRVLAILFSPGARTVAWVAILATSSTYYSVFFLILLAFTGIVVLVRDRKWRPFLAAAATGALTVGVMLVNMLPDILSTMDRGSNPGSLARDEAEADVYAFRIAQLLLPWAGHRVDALRTLRERYDLAYLQGEPAEGPALGIVAAVGLIAAIVIVLLLAVHRRPSWDASPRLVLAGSLSSMAVFAVFVASVGGFSTFVSFLTSSLRGWNRMSIVLAMICLALVALLVDHAVDRAGERWSWRPWVRTTAAVGAATFLLGLGFVDQTPGDAGDRYAATQDRFAADRAYFSQVEARLPADGMVLLLPYIPFPEGETASGFLGSEQLVPYLQTDGLRWTNGGIKGRPTADWPGGLEDYGVDAVADLAALSGSTAIVVQRAALPDRGESLEEALRSATGADPFESADGAYAMYELGAASARVEASTEQVDRERLALRLTDPVLAYPTHEFRTLFDETGGIVYRPERAGAAFSLVNGADQPVDVRLETRIECGGCTGTVEFRLEGDGIGSFELDGAPIDVATAITAPPGTSLVSVHVVTGDGSETARFTLNAPRILDVGVLDFLEGRTTSE